jgi:hypothetical protein
LAGQYWSRAALLEIDNGQATVGQTADNLTSAKMGLELMSELIGRRQQEPDEAGFTEIVLLIGASRERSMQAVNTVLIDLYWQIGEIISRRVAAAQWGDDAAGDRPGHRRGASVRRSGSIGQLHCPMGTWYPRILPQ